MKVTEEAWRRSVSGIAQLAAAPRAAVHAGDDLDRDAVTAQIGQLLAAAAEDERVAALEADHALSGAGVAEKDLVDLVLPDAVLALALADIDPVGVAAHAVENALAQQRVMHHHIGILHQPQGLDRQQVRVARARRRSARRSRAGAARRSSLIARSMASLAPLSSPASTRSAIGPSKKFSQNRRRPSPSMIEAVTALRKRPAKAGERAEPRGQQGFDLLAQAADQDGGRPGAADGNEHRVAVDDARDDHGRAGRAVDDV